MAKFPLNDFPLWKIKAAFSLILLLLACFFALRMILVFASAKNYFSALGAGEIILACLNGMRFDMASAAYIVMPFIFLFFLPVNSGLYLKITLFAGVSAVFALVLFGAADVAYFGMFTKHLTSEPAAAAGSIRFLIGFALTEYPLWLAVILFAFSGAVFVCFRCVGYNYTRKNLSGGFIVKNTALILVFAFCAVIAARGKIFFNNRPLKVMDAGIFGNEKMADIALTGIFPAYEYTVKFQNVITRFPPPSVSHSV